MVIVWLKADPQVLHARMLKDPQTLVQRPSLTGKGIFQEIEEVMASRAPFYERAAEVQLDTSTMDVAGVVEEVVSMIKVREREG
jgi:shikimate kinase